MEDQYKASVLVVDDEPKICRIISDILSFRGYRVVQVFNGKEAIKIVESDNIDVVLVDVMMPGMSGMELLDILVKLYPETPIIMISAYGTIKMAVEAIRQGAYDFIEKPLDADRILITVKNSLDKRNLTLKTRQLQEEVLDQYKMVGNSAIMREIFKQIEMIAPTPSKVLITGESGTGKELVAQAIHNISPRFGNAFVKINCAAIPDSLIESELFGYEKGAFTGARHGKKGKIEMANKGTLFLDEIGDLKPDMQAKLLRMIETQEFERLGSLKTIKVDFRLITATNKDLKREMARGKFREDLYYRIKNVEIHLPPLRKRKEDITLLVEYFMEEFCDEYNFPLKKIHSEIIEKLIAYDWPGNIRELKNYVENLVIYNSENQGIHQIVPFNMQQTSTPGISSLQTLKQARDYYEKEYIIKVLNTVQWNVTKAARILGVNRTYLHKKMSKLSIYNESEK